LLLIGEKKKPELLASALGDVAIALGGEGDRALGERFWSK
jgi:hypothetical protein